MSDTDQTVAYNSVACEACRSKKCKCDRQLPGCAQCSKTGQQCVYPQTFKRGFPEGYLAGLEQRLLETECALFEALTALSGKQTDINHASQKLHENSLKQSKSARMQEWQRLSLGSETQRWHWFAEKANMVGVPAQTNFQSIEPPSDHNDLLPGEDWLPQSQFMQTQSGNVHPSPQQSQAYPSTALWQSSRLSAEGPAPPISPTSSSSPPVADQPSMAQTLLQNQPKRFF